MNVEGNPSELLSEIDELLNPPAENAQVVIEGDAIEPWKANMMAIEPAALANLTDNLEQELTDMQERVGFAQELLRKRMIAGNIKKLPIGDTGIYYKLKNTSTPGGQRIDVLRRLLEDKTLRETLTEKQKQEIDEAIWWERPAEFLKANVPALRKVAEYGGELKKIVDAGAPYPTPGTPKLEKADEKKK